jgi:hypothetical protein
LAAPACKRRQSQTFSESAIQLYLSIKCLLGQSLGMVQSLLKLVTTSEPAL